MNCRQQNAVFNFENIFLVLQYIQLPYEHNSNYTVIAYLLYFNVIIINEQFLLEKHKVDTEMNKINDALDAFFRHIKLFIRFHLAFVFGLQTLYLIDFSKIHQCV